MNKRYLSVLLVMLTLTFSAFSSYAQDDFTDTELENIAFVADAYDKMATLATMYTAGNQNLTQEISAQGQSIEIILFQEISGASVLDEDNPATEMTIIQQAVTDVGFQEATLDMTMEMVQVDGDFYVRITEVTDAFAAQYPEGWVNLSEDAGSVPGMELFNIDQMSSMTNTGLQYPINEETIATIEELDDFESIEAVETRVFAVTLDTQALLQTEAFDLLSGMLDADALGLDVEDMMNQMFENAAFALVIWIGVDDGLVHRTDLTLEIDADLNIPGVGAINLIQNLESSFTYSEFDAAVEITAPEA